MAVTGGTLDLQGGGVTLAQLGTVTNTGGVVNLQTTLNNAGTTLNVGQGTALGTLTLATNGTIQNGTIVDHGSGIAFAGGTLSGVTYDGTMDMSATGSSVYVTNGLTLAGVNGTGTGTINLTGRAAASWMPRERDDQQRHPEHRQQQQRRLHLQLRQAALRR